MVAIPNEPFKSYSKNFTVPAILQNCLSENAPGSIYLNFVVVDVFQYSLVVESDILIAVVFSLKMYATWLRLLISFLN